MKKGISAYVFAAALIALPTYTQAASWTVAPGTTGQGGMTMRLGLSQPWDTRWFSSDVGHLTGYWDAGYTWWESGPQASARHSLSFAPVFVYEFNGQRFQPFVELGIGVSVFSGTRVGDRALGSAFNFEDRIGFGVRFNRDHVVGIRAIHYSNADIASPNDGIESYSIYYSRRF